MKISVRPDLSICREFVETPLDKLKLLIHMDWRLICRFVDFVERFLIAPNWPNWYMGGIPVLATAQTLNYQWFQR
jgi:hypothetical protein